ncbi:MAG: thioredoxin-disulfide reductase [Clostridia bacterium]|nr:thioredoxin-disulfide reductase [Clostridia bacterium]
MMEKIYDTIIIGGGPAGYTAALYAARAGLDTLIIEKFSAGGQMTQTQLIENYPGFSEGIDGFTLGDNMKKSAETFGAVTETAEVLSVDLLSTPKRITADNGDYFAKTVIIATGAEHKHLGIEHEDELIGRGVGYCAACDGMMYRKKTVAVVGGGNSAVSDALLLSRICEKVYVIHRRDSFRASKVYHEPMMKAENVEILWNSKVDELLFDRKLTGIKIADTQNGDTREIALDGLFISIGRTPESGLFEGQIELDANKYIVAEETTRTNIGGVFAAGDVRTKALRQIVTAAADGAVAAYFAEEYITENK